MPFRLGQHISREMQGDAWFLMVCRISRLDSQSHIMIMLIICI